MSDIKDLLDESIIALDEKKQAQKRKNLFQMPVFVRMFILLKEKVG